MREKSGAGVMDAKKALVEVEGDIEKAIELLREKGMAKAAKKAVTMPISTTHLRIHSIKQSVPSLAALTNLS